ncbi:MAG: hypothetical protein AB7V19_07485 [Candidatus Bipolaricaulia bacterium]
MDVREQLMLQAWFGNLKRALEEDPPRVEWVISELDTALSRVEEDQEANGLARG